MRGGVEINLQETKRKKITHTHTHTHTHTLSQTGHVRYSEVRWGDEREASWRKMDLTGP